MRDVKIRPDKLHYRTPDLGRRGPLAHEDRVEAFDEDASSTFDLHVAVLSHAASEIVDHGLAIAVLICLAAGPIGPLHFVFAIETVDIQ
jgi:hypothetical protein